MATKLLNDTIPSFDHFSLTGSGSTGDVSGMSVKAAGASVSRTTAARAADAVNVKDFGAVGDGATDDAAAINAAFNYVRTTRGATQSRIVFPHGNYLVRSTINATGLKSKSILVDGGGANITGKVAGKPIIDALSTEYVRWRDLTITGDSGTVPSVGLRIGRAGITTNDNSDNIVVENVAIQGSFTFAALHNLNAETSQFSHLVIVNSYASASSYGLVMDGINHFGATSDFVTVTAPVDTPNSFNENVIINADIRHNSNGVPIWMAGTTRHRWIASYAAAISGPNCVVLYSAAGADVNSYLDLDLHIETPNVVDAFLITGSNATPSFLGFMFRDHLTNATNSVFKLDTGITSASMLASEIQIGGMFGGAKLLDDPIRWTLSGIFTSGSGSNFNYANSQITGIHSLQGAMRLMNPTLYTSEIHTVATVTSSFTFGAQHHNVQAGEPSTPLAAPVMAALPLCNSTIQGRTYGLVKADASANAVTLAAAGTDTINGETTVPLASQWDTVTIQCNGSGLWLKGLQ